MSPRWRSHTTLVLVIALLTVTSTLIVGGLWNGFHGTPSLSLASC